MENKVETHLGDVGEPIVVKINKVEPFAEVTLSDFVDIDRLPYVITIEPDIQFIFGVRGFLACRVPSEDTLCDLQTVVFDEGKQELQYLDFPILVVSQEFDYLIYIYPKKTQLRQEFRKLFIYVN